MKKRNQGSYEIGYGRPPKKCQFKKGQSGNPSGKRTRSPAPDLRMQLERALNRPVTFGSGKQQKTLTQGAVGIERLVDQFAQGDRNARRDLMLLCERLGVDIANREALQTALEDALSAEDEAILADFVKRHGGQYPTGADTLRSLSAKDANRLKPPNNPELLDAPLACSTEPLTQPQEDSYE